jgi:hypothetical protein
MQPIAPQTRIVSNKRMKRKEWLHYAHTHRSILGAAGHIALTPANQLMVMGLKILSLSDSGFEPATFQSLAQRAHQLHKPGPHKRKRALMRFSFVAYHSDESLRVQYGVKSLSGFASSGTKGKHA